MHSRPQTEALLETVSVETLPGDLRRVLVEEEPSERLWLSPFKLFLYVIDVLGSFSLKCWFRSKWWSVFSHNAFNVLHRAPHSTLDDTTGVSSVLLTLRYKKEVMTSPSVVL